MKRRTIYLALALFVAASGAVLFWRARSGRDAGAGTLRAATVERSTLTVAVTASGRIEPAARVGLSFETPARVAEVFVEEGQKVESGAALARLVTDQLELQLVQAQAAVAAAEAQLTQLEAGPRQAEIEQAEANLRAATAQLSTAVANRDQIASGASDSEIAAARAGVAQAEAARKMAQDAYDQIQEEGTRKEQANYDLFTAKRELAAAEARLEAVLSGPGTDELRAADANVSAAAAQRDAAEAQLDRLLAGPSREDLEEARAQAEQARIGLSLAELGLERAILRSPFAGVVSEVNLTPGETSPTRVPPIVLIDDSAFHMTVSVDELDISGLSVGQLADITVEALPDATVTGTVRNIAPIASLETGVVMYDVTIDLAANDAPLRADMTANATVVAEQLTDVLVIPTWAVSVDRETGATFVQRHVDTQTQRIEVELGPRSEGFVKVVSGLSEGDVVVRAEGGNTLNLGSQ